MSNYITIIADGEKIKICQNVVDVMYKYIQKGFFSKESGGILIGKENKSNKNIIINDITTPMSEDKRKYNRFTRKDEGHIKIFKNLYKASDETFRYIGEWHSHPEAIPNFSNIDLNNWIKICEDSNCDQDYYHIIIGYKAVRVWTINNKGIHAKLISTIFWKDVEYE